LNDTNQDSRGDGSRPLDPILATKLAPPGLPARFLARARLVDRLAECARRPLTVISAPAGSGKSTLLAEWRASPAAQALAVAWLSIDAADDDPHQFLRSVAAAFEMAIPGTGARTLALLQGWPAATLDQMVATLLNELADSAREVVLVLDDFHLIRSASIHVAIGLALSRLPPRVHVVVAARTSPSLPLSRLRIQGEILELRAADLRFTVEEAAAFLEGAARLRLPPGTAEALAVRTEGWAAGLQLAALSLQGYKDPDSRLASFTGSHRLVHDYLADEVLRHVPPEVRTFLLRTSILERLSGPLCAAVLGDGIAPGIPRLGRAEASGCQRMLERIEWENLFLVSLDEERRWWRYHRLFGEFLRRRLEEERAEEVAELHRRASIWLEENGFATAAAGHAVEVRDFQRAARLLEHAARGPGRVHRSYSDLATTPPSALLRWLGAMPEVVKARHSLRLVEGWALFQIGQVEAAEARFQDVARVSPRDRRLDGRASAFRAYAAVVRGDARSAIRLSDRALRSAPRGDAAARAMTHIVLGLAHGCQGDSETACNHYRRAQSLASPGDGLPWLYSTSMLGDLELYRGALREAARVYEEALRLAPWGVEWAPAPAALPHARLGAVSYEWNDLDAAARHLDTAIELGTRSESSDFSLVASMQLAHVRQAQADAPAARRLSERAEELMRSGAVVTPWSTNLAQALQVRLWLRQGEVDRAVRWAEARGKDAGGVFHEDRNAGSAAWVRVMLRLDRPDDVLGPLQRWLRDARSAGSTGWALELEILRALALAARGETSAAQAAAQGALEQARAEGWARLFLDEGEPMAPLLEHAARQRSATAGYAAGLLAAMQHKRNGHALPSPPVGDGRCEALVEPLSKRETEILSFIADGLSNAGIAQRLSVTVGTVKTHINNLYGKLGARSRADAVVRARRLGMAGSPPPRRDTPAW
jgi:LuxR family maltose regulon positive regulatory protein